MRRDELGELHYITPIANLPSIFIHGILSHNQMRKRKIEHESVAKQEIQGRRARVVVPAGRPLHDYVNLYFHARNPMMYLRAAQHASLCVLKVRVDVLDLPDVVVTDGNAAGDYPRFAAAPEGISIVDRALTFAEYWPHPDPIEERRRRLAKCAEVLVPDRVDLTLVPGIYASCPETQASVTALVAKVVPHIHVAVNSHLFFR